MNNLEPLKQIKTIKSGSIQMDGIRHREGKTSINWLPSSRYVVLEYATSTEAKRLNSVGLLDPNSLTDKERKNLGLTTKSAAIANTDTEDQSTFIVAAVGPDVLDIEVGDKVLIHGAASVSSVFVEGKTYMQCLEHDIIGKFLFNE